MKRITNFSKQLFVLAFFMACCFTVSAYDFMVDSLSYNVIAENEVEVTHNDSARVSGDVVIPATIVHDGITYHVTRIGDDAFRGCAITSIDIPEGVTAINFFAFNGCSHLEYIEFPNSLVSLGRWVFYNCRSIKTLNIPRNLTDIAYTALAGLSGLVYYTCSPFNPKFKAVDGILYNKDMTMLVAYPQAAPASSFVIPSTVTTLYDYCMHNCDNLIDITIPESVTILGMNIFSGNDNIESIDIPDGVTKMGVTVFGSCPKLSHIHLPASLDSIKSSCFYGCNSLTEMTIPRNVRYLGDYAFSECELLKTVYFEEGSCLEALGFQTFADCPALEFLDMPNTVTTMDQCVFYRCPALKRVHLSRNLTIIPNQTFYQCSMLEELDIPGTVTHIGNAAMYKCTSMKKLKIGDKDAPAGTTDIEHYALAYSNDLVRLELGANLDSMEYGALNNLSNVKLVICWATTPPRANELAMGVAFARTPLYVPRVALDAYREARMWQKFQTILPIEEVGDITGEGNINIGDVTALINILLGDETDRSYFCDVNLDGSISIGDVMSLINILLSTSE
jgi:hypothetical protein